LSEESLTVSGYPAVRLTTSTVIQTFIAVPESSRPSIPLPRRRRGPA
jgi:hypothetical protein